MKRLLRLGSLCVFAALVAAGALHAENGYDAWLRYAPINGPAAREYRAELPAVVATSGKAAQILSAKGELIRGVRGMLGRTLRDETLHGRLPSEGAIIVGTLDDLGRLEPKLQLPATLPTDAFLLKKVHAGNSNFYIITGANPRGVLYGAFAFLRKLALGRPILNLDEKQVPYAPVRWANHWDNLNTSP